MKSCRQCKSSFEITAEDRGLYEKLHPIIGGKQYLIPEPDLCPDCRFKRRLSFRNERVLYHRKSDLTGKQIVSIFSPEKPYKVYDQEEWWSDKWDPMEYGRDFDFNRTFSEQFKELSLAVPHISLYTNNVENSMYTNYCLNLKNCYLLFGGANNEDCFFGKFMTSCKDCVDCLSLYGCEQCYEGVASEDCNNCRFFMYCKNCSNSMMIEDCQNVRNSVLCFGLRNKEFCFMNEFVGEEKIKEIKKDIEVLTNEKITLLWKKLAELKRDLPHLQSHIYASEGCSGDMIFTSKNCTNCFDVTDSEDCHNTAFNPKSVSSLDSTYGSPKGVQFCYNVCSTIGSNLMSTFLCWYVDRVYYSMECFNSKNLFGCVGLKKNEYCIFNKQYSKAEYEKLTGRIIEHMQKTGEWGEYLRPEVCTMKYNETIANEYFPLDRETALGQGWEWWDKPEISLYKGPYIDVPKNIEDVSDDICNKILKCAKTGKLYKIIPQELKFYMENKLPIPQICPDKRHLERLARRNPYKLWDRTCAKCSATIKTTYSPDRPEKVYCEQCYLKEVY